MPRKRRNAESEETDEPPEDWEEDGSDDEPQDEGNAGDELEVAEESSGCLIGFFKLLFAVVTLPFRLAFWLLAIPLQIVGGVLGGFAPSPRRGRRRNTRESSHFRYDRNGPIGPRQVFTKPRRRKR